MDLEKDGESEMDREVNECGSSETCERSTKLTGYNKEEETEVDRTCSKTREPVTNSLGRSDGRKAAKRTETDYDGG